MRSSADSGRAGTGGDCRLHDRCTRGPAGCKARHPRDWSCQIKGSLPGLPGAPTTPGAGARSPLFVEGPIHAILVPDQPATVISDSDIPSHFRVLVVDDEKNIRTTLSVCLEGIGCEVTAVGSAEAALEALERGPFDLAFLDLRLGNDDGLDLLPRLLGARPELAVVVITAYATFDTAVEAIKRGAVDYVPKPFTPAQIRHTVEDVASRRAMARRLVELEAKLSAEVPEADLDTESPAMRAVLDLLARAAASDAPILLRGENGTGKGVLALALHAPGPRAERAVRHRELPDPLRGPPGQRAVRPRAGRLHRRRA